MASPGQLDRLVGVGLVRAGLTAVLLVRSISTLVSVITFLIFLDTFPSVLALELRQLESCSLFLLLDHNYKHLHHLAGDHGLVTAGSLLVTPVPAVEVSITDVLPRYPQTSHGVLLRAGRSTLVVCLVLLSVVWTESNVERFFVRNNITEAQL